MIAFCALTGSEMTVALAQEVLGELWGEEEKVITIDQIQKKVSDLFGVTVTELKAKTRTKAVALPRQIAMYLARQLTHASLAEVGRAFGGKDHTTVLHAVDKIQGLLQEDQKLRRSIDGLIQAIKL
jgi:chromosomal replication initiator protein